MGDQHMHMLGMHAVDSMLSVRSNCDGAAVPVRGNSHGLVLAAVAVRQSVDVLNFMNSASTPALKAPK